MRTDEITSPYYPPRARWWSGIFAPWFRFQRALHLEKLRCPAGFDAAQTFLSFLVPGRSFRQLRREMLGRAVLAIYCASVLVYVIWLGFPAGNFGYGLMLAAHSASIFYLLAWWIRGLGVLQKIALALVTLLALWGILYYPVVGFCERHWALPLSVRGHPVVVNPGMSSSGIKRGDRILYRVDEGHNDLVHNQAVYVEAGYGYGPVLAVAGDHITFATNSFSVNGVEQKSLPLMPTSGEIVVPEKQWFIWPEFYARGRGDVGEARISAMILEIAMVSREQLVGKPYQTWFWRKQILE